MGADAAMQAASVVDGGIKEAFVPVRYKNKIKTRGAQVLSDSSADLPMDGDEDEDDIRPRVEVPRSTYEVLSAMLPSSKEEHSRKQFRWNQFVSAMEHIGFEYDKLHGRAQIFKPKAKEYCLLTLPRSIQSHKPEEVRKGSKIPPDKIRVFGNRLKHAFGWEGGLFVLSDTSP